MEMTAISSKLTDIILLIFLISISCILALLVFPQVPTFSIYEGSPLMHISEARMIQDSFPSIPSWNNNWYFGNPFLRFYPPLSQYLMGSIGWITNSSILQSYQVFVAIIFSAISSIAFYFCRTLRFSRLTAVISALFVVTSFSLYSYWDSGSTPNIVATMFSFILLAFVAKAIETGKTKYIIGSGIFIAAVALSHLQNLLIIVVLLPIFTFIVSYFRETLFGSKVSKRSAIPFFIESWLIGGLLASWWYIPYIVEGGFWRAAPYLAFSTQTQQSVLTYITFKASQLIGLNLTVSNYISPGMIAIGIACIGFIPMLKKRPPTRVWLSVAFFALTLLILTGFFSLLQVPLGMSDRFSPFFALFTGILAGYSLKVLYDNISKSNRKVGSILLLLILVPTLIFNSYTIMTTFNNNRAPELNQPQFITELEKYAKPGERVITDDIAQQWKLTAYTDIQQWGGSDAAAMTNQFAYWFWNKINYKSDVRYLDYFSRSFNVRFYMRPLPGMTQIQSTGIWEKNDFNSSLVETINSNTNRILFIGQHTEYMNLFLSIAKLNPQDILLVYGGAMLSYDVDTLKNFQAIYIDSMYAINQDSDILTTYLQSGGGMILDFGLNPSETWTSLSPPMPAATIKPYTLIDLNKTDFSSKIAYNVDLKNTTDSTQAVELISQQTESLATIDNKTIMASSDFGQGKILISGLGLPRIAVNEIGQEESQLLLNTIKYVLKNTSQANLNFPSFSLGSSDVTVNMADAQKDEALWLKISYYPGWTASSNGQQLRIFEAGPGFMLVFPKIQGNGTIYFSFTTTGYAMFGQILSFSAVIYIAVRILMSTKAFNKFQISQKVTQRLKNILKRQTTQT